MTTAANGSAMSLLKQNRDIHTATPKLKLQQLTSAVKMLKAQVSPARVLYVRLGRRDNENMHNNLHVIIIPTNYQIEFFLSVKTLMSVTL